MRKLFLICAFLLSALPASAAITLVPGQVCSYYGGPSAQVFPCVFPNPIGPHHTAAFFFTAANGIYYNLPVVTGDSGTPTYENIGTCSGAGHAFGWASDGMCFSSFYYLDTGGGTTTITVTNPSGNVAYGVVVGAEFSEATAIDATGLETCCNVGTALGAAPSNSITPTSNGDLIVTYNANLYVTGNPCSAPTGSFIFAVGYGSGTVCSVGAGHQGAIAYQVQATAAPITGTWNITGTAGPWVSHIIALHSAATNVRHKAVVY